MGCCLRDLYIVGCLGSCGLLVELVVGCWLLVYSDVTAIVD